jgi:hypothetical protein
VSLLIQNAQSLIDLVYNGWQVDRVQDRKLSDQRAADIGRPVKGVDVQDIECCATLAQLEKKFQEEMSLSKESSVTAAMGV